MTAQKNFFAGGYANPRNTGGEAPVREPVDPAAAVTPDVPVVEPTPVADGTLAEQLTAAAEAEVATSTVVSDPDNEGNETQVAPSATAAGDPVGEFTQTVESFDGPPQA